MRPIRRSGCSSGSFVPLGRTSTQRRRFCLLDLVRRCVWRRQFRVLGRRSRRLGRISLAAAACSTAMDAPANSASPKCLSPTRCATHRCQQGASSTRRRRGPTLPICDFSEAPNTSQIDRHVWQPHIVHERTPVGMRLRTRQGGLHLTVAERLARGKAARREVPRSCHAGFTPGVHRPDRGTAGTASRDPGARARTPLGTDR